MPVYKTQRKAAEHYGVTETAVRKWEDHEAWPCNTGEYDTDLIDRWRTLHQKDRKREAVDRADQLAQAEKLVKLQLLQLKLDREKEDAQRRKGDILSRSEMETALSEILIVARDQLLSIPHQMARLGNTKREQRRLAAESERIVRKTLEDMASMAEELQHPEQAD